MNAQNYRALLRDPRWQRKRLEVMRRADFRCEDCGSERRTLNVHHERYDGLPWEARDEDLACLCESCHRRRHELQRIGLPSAEDIDLETQIARAEHEMLNAASSESRRLAWDRFASLIALRSPRQVARLEIQKGLR